MIVLIHIKQFVFKFIHRIKMNCYSIKTASDNIKEDLILSHHELLNNNNISSITYNLHINNLYRINHQLQVDISNIARLYINNTYSINSLILTKGKESFLFIKCKNKFDPRWAVLQTQHVSPKLLQKLLLVQ